LQSRHYVCTPSCGSAGCNVQVAAVLLALLGYCRQISHDNTQHVPEGNVV